MSRLPVVAGDNDGWGTILNDFLSVAHNADGTLKSTAIPGVGPGVTDNRAPLQTALDALTTNSLLELPAGILTIRSASGGVGLSITGKSGVTIRGIGLGTILRFDGVTATDGLRIDDCAQFTLENVAIQVTNASTVTNAIQYTCPDPGVMHDGVFRDVKITNPSKAYRQINDATTVTGSAVITSATAAFAAGDVGCGIGICQPTAGVHVSTINSVNTRTATLNGAITSSQTNVTLNAAIPSAPAGQYTILVDSELMLVTAGGTGTSLTVGRAYNQTTGAAHSNGATVTTYQATLAANVPDTTATPYSAQIQNLASSVMNYGLALATDHATAGKDIPNTTFFNVIVEGALGAAWKLGGGGGISSNILNTSMTACYAIKSPIGVWIDGATMSWMSSHALQNGIDFKMTQSATQPVLIKQCRSELSGMFWECVGGATSGQPSVALENFAALAFGNSDGVPIRHTASAPLSMRDGLVARSTAGLTVLISAGGAGASTPLYYTASNISYNGGNASPHPAASTTIVRSITPGPRLSTAGLTANRASYPAVSDSGLAIGQATNGRSGTATLTAGAVTISNTSVTAATLVKTWVQTLGTVTTPKVLYPSARTAGTSITITSSDATDTSTFYYELVEPF